MNIINKIREKGLSGCIKAVKHKVISICNKILLVYFKRLPIDENSVVFESEGDCCDNAYALFDFMRYNGYLEKYKVYWFVHNPEKYCDSEHIHYLNKDLNKKIFFNSLKISMTSKYYLFDHPGARSIYKFREEQKNIYLDHGYVGFKAPKGSEALNAKEIFVTGKMPALGCIDWYGNKAKQIILGSPRLDYFFNENDSIRIKCINLVNKEKYRKTIIWMPTFRQCDINKELSEDYINNETGLPLFNTIESLNLFNKYLCMINIKIVLKIHPLQANLEVFNKKFSNLQIIKNELLEESGIQLYQFIPIFDALITDYSSVSVDYFLVDKPIIYILDDINEYKKARGLYPSNATDYMPGDHVYNIDELKHSIDRIVNDKDIFRERRNNILPQFFKYRDGNSCRRILNYLEIVKD